MQAIRFNIVISESEEYGHDSNSIYEITARLNSDSESFVLKVSSQQYPDIVT